MIFDGKSQLIWRSGVKHDCVKVLELQKRNGYYINKLNEEVELEEDLIYYYLKGSYLKDKVINKSSLFTIITQKKVGESTDFIKNNLPLTYKYLSSHQEHFDSRKSSIYKNKPNYSIFGIGDYSFKPYKVAIAGLYKKYSVSLIIPDENGKPVMLDDTSYFLGFDNIAPALIVFSILNNEEVIKFVDSLSFNDTKRKYSKELLMRIDLFKITQILSFKTIKKELDILLPDYSHLVIEKDWIEFINSIKNQEAKLVLY